MSPGGQAEAAGYPLLYSFRRCPYAMRARMAIRYSGVTVELREVLLRALPESLLACSPKGTVPVLALPDGTVLEESRDIMEWALARHDPGHWLPAAGSDAAAQASELICANDTLFKPQLDCYKYAVRYPEHPADYYRAQGEQFLQQLELRLQQHAWLLGKYMTVADVAIFPFLRQFAHVDRDWFCQAPYPCLQHWLQRLLDSELFQAVMRNYPPWKTGDVRVLFP
jgi:glutathione S-transferase